jgi:choline dehydrogenase
VGGPFADGDRGTFFIGVALLKPASRGTVRLRSADPSAAPRIDLGYFREPRDLDRLTTGMIRIREPAGTGPIAELSRGEELAPGPEHLRRRPQPTSAVDPPQRVDLTTHPASFPPPGFRPAAGAVVDTCGRVHGIGDLTVADASIMPDIPSAPAPLPTPSLIAERIASRW